MPSIEKYQYSFTLSSMISRPSFSEKCFEKRKKKYFFSNFPEKFFRKKFEKSKKNMLDLSRGIFSFFYSFKEELLILTPFSVSMMIPDLKV